MESNCVVTPRWERRVMRRTKETETRQAFPQPAANRHGALWYPVVWVALAALVGSGCRFHEEGPNGTKAEREPGFSSRAQRRSGGTGTLAPGSSGFGPISLCGVTSSGRFLEETSQRGRARRCNADGNGDADSRRGDDLLSQAASWLGLGGPRPSSGWSPTHGTPHRTFIPQVPSGNSHRTPRWKRLQQA